VFPDVVILPSGTLDFDALADWKPQADFYCKRRGDWPQTAGADDGSRFQGMPYHDSERKKRHSIYLY
jgi:hypothetical protein